MNTEEAKRVLMSLILKKLGYTPVYTTEEGDFYLSLFRDEETPSLRVKDHLWFDVMTGEEGDSFEFVRKHLKHTVQDDTDADVLKWINFMIGYVSPFSVIPKNIVNAGKRKDWEIRQIKPIENDGLIRYLESRGIDLEIAKQLLVQVNLFDKKKQKSFCALGLANESKGYELINPEISGHVGKRSIRFIHGKNGGKSEGIHIFLDVFDYLTFLNMPDGQTQYYDAIILNSYGLLEEASSFIKGYGYQTACTWFENTITGQYCSKLFRDFCQLEENLAHKMGNKIYTGHDSLNAWHVHNLSPKQKAQP